MVENDDQDGTEIDLETTDVDEHFVAIGALRFLVDDPDGRAIEIASTPNPMFVTVEDGELAFWAFDYSTNCQVRYYPEDEDHGPDTVVDNVHAYAARDYPIDIVSSDVIDDEPKPVAKSLADFERGAEQ